MELKRYPITVAQNLLLTMLQGAKHKQVLNVCVSLLIKLDVDFNLLAQSVKEAMARDDSTRTRFTKNEDGSIEQYIVPPDDIPCAMRTSPRKAGRNGRHPPGVEPPTL